MAPAGTKAANTCDGKELCGLAKKVPKTLKGGNLKSATAVDNDRLNQSQLVAIIDKLFKRQMHIAPIHRILFSDDYPMGDDPCSLLNDARWPADGANALRKVPKGWIAAWLLMEYSKHGLTKTHIEGLENDDTQNLHFLFSVALQLPLSGTIPGPTQYGEKLAKELFAQRFSVVKARLPMILKAGGISATGALDHGEHRAFSLVFAEGERAVSVKHTASGHEKALPDHVFITRAFIMHDAWLGAHARVELEPSAFVLSQFFDPDDRNVMESGASDKAAKAMLQELADTIMAKYNDGAAVSVEEAVAVSKAACVAVSSASKVRVVTRTKAAREAMTRMAERRSQKKRIRLT